ncbi:MAG: DUF6360 family protein [Haloarculaceae archaeon]
MADRILPVTGYTTFDLLDATVEGHEFDAETFAVLNVATTDGGDRVELQVELDHTDLPVAAHADRLRLSPAEARELAAELESRADDLTE